MNRKISGWRSAIVVLVSTGLAGLTAYSASPQEPRIHQTTTHERSTSASEAAIYLGGGYNSLTGQFIGQAIDVKEARVESGHIDVTTKFAMVDSKEEFLKTYDSIISASVGGGYAGFSANAEYKKTISNSLSTSNRCVTLIVYSSIKGLTTTLNDGKFNSNATQLLGSGSTDTFNKAYGNAFCRQAFLGGFMVVTYRADYSSSTEVSAEDVHYALNLKYQSAFSSASANVSSDEKTKMETILNKTQISGTLWSTAPLSGSGIIDTAQAYKKCCDDFSAYYNKVLNGQGGEWSVLGRILRPYEEVTGSGYTNPSSFPTYYNPSEFVVNNLRKSAQDAESITLSWSALPSTCREGYHVYCFTAWDGAQLVAQLPNGTTSFRYENNKDCDFTLWVVPYMRDYEGTCDASISGNALTTNVALNKPTCQSSTYGDCVSLRAVDGNTNGVCDADSVSHTNADPQAWWIVYLGVAHTVNEVVIWNRTDGGYGARLTDFHVDFLNANGAVIKRQDYHTTAGEQTIFSEPARGVYAVRVQLNGTDFLQLAEVQVFGIKTGPETNVALGKPTCQSSTYGLASFRAVDGNTYGVCDAGSVSHTNADPQAWWIVYLGAEHTVSEVVIWNRTDGGYGTRLTNFHVDFLNANGAVIKRQDYRTTAGERTSFSEPASGVYAVRVQLNGTNFLQLAEVQVFGIKTGPETNVAFNKFASQSSTYYDNVASRAVDGNTNGVCDADSVSHTNADLHAWWRVYLGSAYQVTMVALWNRTDGYGERLTDFHVDYLDAYGNVIASQNHPGTAEATTIFQQTVRGVYSVRVQLNGTNFLQLAEVEVFGFPQ